jgi:opacity protein-like surface antigen
MKRLLVGTLLALGSAAAALAQAPGTTNNETQGAAPIDFATTSGARVTLLEPVHFSQPTFLTNEVGDAALPKDWTGSAAPAVAAPEPAPEPRFVFGGRDDFRWQLGIGFAWTRFRSSIFNASAVGVNTSLSYFTNDWFAIEGNVNSTYAPEIFANEHVKLIVYGVGPKIAWRQRRWEPWLHGLVGGLHEQPQIAGNSRNGFAAQLGGGADFRWVPRLALRLEADYVRSSLFSGNQNNFQLAAGIVFHF